MDALNALQFDANGLIPVITQDAVTGQILMFAYATKEALEKTLITKEAHYFSRSRQQLWHKGATSGRTQTITEVRFDCDQDAVLYKVISKGPACHTGEQSCFYRALGEEGQGSLGDVMGLLEHVVSERLQNLPEESYVTKLHQRGVGYIAQKVVEEAGESIVAALEKKDNELLGEAADLLFHLTVLLRERGLSLMQVMQVLELRHKQKPKL
jgi:phosphoribosyl-ATP pyrophosphohydrolase/phosphoribosyl-AMP cyclohydrolase